EGRRPARQDRGALAVRLLGTLLVAALAALAGRSLAGERAERAEPGGDAPALAALTAQIQELRSANEHLAGEIEARSSALVAARESADVVSDADIEAALARWRASHPEAVARASAAQAERAARAVQGELDLAKVPMSEIVRELAHEGL